MILLKYGYKLAYDVLQYKNGNKIVCYTKMLLSSFIC